MVGGPLSGRWMKDEAPRVAFGAVIDRPPAPEDTGDGPPLDAETAHRFALFAYNVARKFFPYRADLVEEAVQEALTRTCERWERAHRNGRPEAWVVKTASNICQEKLRQERRGERFSPVPGPQQERDEDLVRALLLADALRKLTSRQRAVIVWRYLFDFSVTETAAALGLTDSKVRDASHNGIKRLRRVVGEEWSDWA